jgi:hypothetical protein
VSGHHFTRPGQVAPDRPAPDTCMVCGQPEGAHHTAADPFDTEREARAAAHSAVPPEAGWSILSAAGNRELLRRATEAAGVRTCPYDDQIIGWLAGFEDSICAVIAGWVRRARPSGDELALILAALDDAAEARRERAACQCPDCATDPTGRCEQHRADLQTAAAYSSLHARLAGA